MAGIRLTLGRGARDQESGRFYTILILPDARGRFRKLQVTRAFVSALLLVAMVALAAALLTPHLLLQLQTGEAAHVRLQNENQRLRGERDELETAVGRLAARLEGVEATTGRLARELGVDELPSLEPGTGGAGVRATAGRSILSGELKALSRRSTSLEASLEQLDEAFRARIRLLNSTPNRMPTEGWFSHGYGWRKDPFSGARQFHRGIDIVNHAGTAVRAPAEGIVSRTLRASDLGKTVDISHGFGYVTRYAHLSEILVRPGQKVQRGEMIGKMGSTGRSTGPHLHYEVFRDGRRVNPWKYLGQRGS